MNVLRLLRSRNSLPKDTQSWRRLLQNALQLEKKAVPRPQHFAVVSLTSGKPIESFPVPKDNQARQSSVLILISPVEGDKFALRGTPDAPFQDMTMLLTMRSSTMRTHSGQMAFPGGRMDLGETIDEAASRECMEEVGVLSSQYEILGHLSPVWSYPSKSWVTPVVALAHSRVEARISSPDEVAGLHYLHMSQLLCDSENSHHQLARHFSHSAFGAIRFPCFFASSDPDTPIDDGVHPFRGADGPLPHKAEDGELTPVHVSQCDGTLVWGLTAGMICELLCRVVAVLAHKDAVLMPSPYIVRDPDGDSEPSKAPSAKL